MKKNSKVVAFLLTLVMVFTLVAPGVKTYAAADATDYQASSTQSEMKSVKMDGTKITGSFVLWGYASSVSVYEGNQLGSATPSANKVGTLAPPNGQWWPIASETAFEVNVTDGGKSPKGYTVVVTNGNEWAGAYIPYAGPVYQVGIQKDGENVEKLTMSLYEDVVSGFTFIHEAGQSFSYSVDKQNIIEVKASGDSFTVKPLAAGTARITAIVGGVSEATLDITVKDDASVSAVWLENGKEITNNAVLNAEAGIAYGFSVKALPAAKATVSVTSNTAGAEVVESSDPSQYPYTLKAKQEGSAKINISANGKNLTFTVNFAKAEVYFDFYMDANLTEVAEPMIAVEKGKTVTVYTSLPVGSWDTSDAKGITIVNQNNKTSITFTADTVDSISTIVALDADKVAISFFDVYVTGEETGESDLDVTLTASSSNVNKGSLVKFTAKATGGEGGYKYQYVVKYAGKEAHIHAAETSTVCRYLMSQSGAREVVVIVTDAKGNVATASYTVTVR